MMKIRFAILALLLLASCKGQPQKQETSPQAAQQSRPVTQEEAVQIADKASRKAMDIPKEVKPVVNETADVFVVTYPLTLPKGVRGGDYYTKVKVDKSTGKITELLVAE
jgi:hypothetical protein